MIPLSDAHSAPENAHLGHSTLSQKLYQHLKFGIFDTLCWLFREGFFKFLKFFKFQALVFFWLRVKISSGTPWGSSK